MRCQRGLTLTESLVVVAIMVVVAAISFPIMASAKRSSLTRASIHQMQQLYISLQIYRADHDGSDSTFANSYELGMPPDHTFLDKTYGAHPEVWKSPFPAAFDVFNGSAGGEFGDIAYAGGGYRPGGPDSLNLYDQEKYLETYRENAVVFMDYYINPPGTKMANPFYEKSALAILFSGKVVNQRRRGRAWHFSFYSDSPPSAF